MTFNYAKIVEKWEYEGVVKNISMEAYYKSYHENNGVMRGPGNCHGFVALVEDKLIGLFEYYNVDDSMSIGLALNPNMVGRGIGKDFVQKGIEFGLKTFSYKGEYVKLTVNVNNSPAIRVYEKAGFKTIANKDDEIEMRLYLK